MSHLPLSPAAMEGAYRFIRSPHVRAEAIANAGFAVTTSQARDHSLLLALEDTTALTFNHASVRDELGHTNQGSSRALLAHFVLLFAPRERKVVGLAAQQIWTRDVSKRGQSRESLAILGGWKETKQTGRASIAVLWEGWFRL